MAALDKVGSAWITDSTTGTTATSAANSVASGNSVAVFIPYEGATGTVTVSGVSDTEGNTYTRVADSAITHADGEPAGEWWYSSDVVGDAALAVTVAFSGSPGLGQIVCYELEGPIQFKDAATGQAPDSAAFSTGNVVTDAPAMVLLGCVGYQVLSTPAGGGSPTFTHDAETDQITSFCCHYRSSDADGETIAPAASWASATSRTVSSSVAFQAGEAPPAGGPVPVIVHHLKQQAIQ